MSKHFFIASFESEPDLLGAVRTARHNGHTIEDVLTPYAVHGLDEAMGLRASRLSWACLAFAATGASLAFWLEHWTSAVDWPLNVGGKPFNSLPAFVPVAFELAVLFAGLGTVAAMFARCRLFPGRRAALGELRATDDRFVMLIAETDATFDLATARQLFAKHHAVWCGEWVDGHLRRLDGEPLPAARDAHESDTLGPPADAEVHPHPAVAGHPRKRRAPEMVGSIDE